MQNVTITHGCGHVVTYRKRGPISDLDRRVLAQWRGKQRNLICKDCLTDALTNVAARMASRP